MARVPVSANVGASPSTEQAPCNTAPGDTATRTIPVDAHSEIVEDCRSLAGTVQRVRAQIEAKPLNRACAGTATKMPAPLVHRHP